MWSPEALYEINQIAVNLSRSGKTERDALFMYLMKGESFRKSCGQNEEDSLYTTRINCFLPVSKNASLSDDGTELPKTLYIKMETDSGG